MKLYQPNMMKKCGSRWVKRHTCVFFSGSFGHGAKGGIGRFGGRGSGSSQLGFGNASR